MSTQSLFHLDFMSARRDEKFPLAHRKEVTGMKQTPADFGGIKTLKISSAYAPLASAPVKITSFY